MHKIGSLGGEANYHQFLNDIQLFVHKIWSFEGGDRGANYHQFPNDILSLVPEIGSFGGGASVESLCIAELYA